ncbi:putative zinc finger [Lyophyllum shimeji]|uniref:Zinc finger n=1 Tax=Lyophyllum shimeji TaxID=47721 RepID=A0A9P3PTX1_LYOSH|nr:putative zinc finger [Lyophyllum shimeji]
MNDVQRPITSKARGICKYYTTQRGCFAGDTCKFLHTTEPAVDPSSSRPPYLTPYDEAKRCKYYAAGYCKHGAQCWFRHGIKDDPPKPGPPEADDEELCSICFEKPSIYGLLGGCSHIFCIDCIRQWRDPAGKGGGIDNNKKCPMCRAKCRYIIPSSRFWKEGSEEKAQVVRKYKASMSKVPCKHFQASKKKNPGKPMCPFGKDCFYQHLNDDGTPHVLKYGVDRSMREWRHRRQRNSGFGPFSFITGDGIDLRGPIGLDFLPNVGGSDDAINVAGTFAMDLFDQMVAQLSGGRGRGGGTSRGRRRRDSFHEELSRARMEIIAGAISAGRGAPHRRETQPHQNLRPVVVPGTLPPTHWDFDGDGEEEDDGWGWNDLVDEAAHNGNFDVMERLELLANHMLGSTRTDRGRDSESSPPPLEPIGREDTPPPLLIPFGTGWQVEHDNDMPALESVSNSSESDDGSDDEHGSDYESIDTAQRVERAFDLAFNLTERPEEARPSSSRSQGGTTHTSGARPRFSTVVEREERRADIETEADDEVDDERGAEPQEIDSPKPEGTASLITPAEPPFVTDGRGRVVWSNKDAETTPEPGESQPRATGSRSLLGRVFDAFMY